MQETEARTRKFFSGLLIIVRENVEKGAAWLRDSCDTHTRGSQGGRGY